MVKRRRSSNTSSNKAAKRPKQKIDFADIDEILYEINSEEVGQTLYLIKWPASWEPAANVADCDQVLRRFEAGNNLNCRINTAPYKFNDPAATKYEVYKILEKREKIIGQVEYLVEWKLTWEPADKIAPKDIQSFLKNRKSDTADQKVTIEGKRFVTTAFGDDDYDNEIEAYEEDINDNENGNEDDENDNESGDEIGHQNAVFINHVDSNGSSGYSSEQHDSPEQQNIELNNSCSDMSLAGDFGSDISDDYNDDDEDDVINKVIAIKGDKFNFGFVVELTNGEHGFVTRAVAVEEFPQKVIEFYQSKIKFLTPAIPAERRVKTLYSSFFNP